MKNLNHFSLFTRSLLTFLIIHNSSLIISTASPTITAYSGGAITWTNAVTNGYYQLQWASDLTLPEPWSASWSNQARFGGSSNRTVQIAIPSYYRILYSTNAFDPDPVRPVTEGTLIYPSGQLNGNVTLQNLTPGSWYAVDWLSGTNWCRDLNALGNITATALQHTCTAPIQFRYQVITTNAPATIPGMTWIFPGAYTQGPPGSTSVVEVAGFHMDNTEITEALWTTIRQWAITNGYTDLPAIPGLGTNYPASSISWHDACKWANARSEYETLTPAYTTDPSGTNIYRTGTNTLATTRDPRSVNGYRLPTEAEWERAARGFIVGGLFPWGGTNLSDCTPETANYRNSNDIGEFSPNLITPVGGYREVPAYLQAYLLPPVPGGSNESSWTLHIYTYPPNGYGLYDLSGNLWEWCWDWYAYDAYPATGSNPTGPSSGSRKVIRGGSYGNEPRALTVYARSLSRPDIRRSCIGFRCIRNNP